MACQSLTSAVIDISLTLLMRNPRPEGVTGPKRPASQGLGWPHPRLLVTSYHRGLSVRPPLPLTSASCLGLRPRCLPLTFPSSRHLPGTFPPCPTSTLPRAPESRAGSLPASSRAAPPSPSSSPLFSSITSSSPPPLLCPSLPGSLPPPPVAGPPLPGHWWLLAARLFAAPSPEPAAREVGPPPQRPRGGPGTRRA